MTPGNRQSHGANSYEDIRFREMRGNWEFMLPSSFSEEGFSYTASKQFNRSRNQRQVALGEEINKNEV